MLEVPPAILPEVVSGGVEAVVCGTAEGKTRPAPQGEAGELESVGYEERDQAPETGIRELSPE